MTMLAQIAAWSLVVQGSTLGTLLVLSWRVSHWKTKTEARIEYLEKGTNGLYDD